YQRVFSEHYHASPAHILYASKAYLSPLIARLVADQGMGLDVVSGGELKLAQCAGFPLERISFHGNNKSIEELRLAACRRERTGSHARRSVSACVVHGTGTSARTACGRRQNQVSQGDRTNRKDAPIPTLRPG